MTNRGVAKLQIGLVFTIRFGSVWIYMYVAIFIRSMLKRSNFLPGALSVLKPNVEKTKTSRMRTQRRTVHASSHRVFHLRDTLVDRLSRRMMLCPLRRIEIQPYRVICKYIHKCENVLSLRFFLPPELEPILHNTGQGDSGEDRPEVEKLQSIPWTATVWEFSLLLAFQTTHPWVWRFLAQRGPGPKTGWNEKKPSGAATLSKIICFLFFLTWESPVFSSLWQAAFAV